MWPHRLQELKVGTAVPLLTVSAGNYNRRLFHPKQLVQYKYMYIHLWVPLDWRNESDEIKQTTGTDHKQTVRFKPCRSLTVSNERGVLFTCYIYRASAATESFHVDRMYCWTVLACALFFSLCRNVNISASYNRRPITGDCWGHHTFGGTVTSRMKTKPTDLVVCGTYTLDQTTLVWKPPKMYTELYFILLNWRYSDGNIIDGCLEVWHTGAVLLLQTAAASVEAGVVL